MSTPEGRVKAKVRQLLDGYEPRIYYHMPVSMGLGMRTIDFLGCFYGRFFGVETKAPGKKPTKLQRHVILQILGSGGRVFVIDGEKSLEDLAAWLKEVEYQCLFPETTNK